MSNLHALGTETLVWLENRLDEVEEACVVEFGSGRSTEVVLNHPRCRQLISIEHEPYWLETTRARLLENALDPARWRIIVAPLVFVNIPRVSWYDSAWEMLKASYSQRAEVGAALHGADLVLVDGPSGLERRWLPVMLALVHCPPGTVIVLDDLNTAPSFHALVVNEWIAQFQAVRRCEVELLSIDHGVLCLRVGDDPAVAPKLPPERGRLLYQLLQAPARMLVNGYWLARRVWGGLGRRLLGRPR